VLDAHSRGIITFLDDKALDPADEQGALRPLPLVVLSRGLPMEIPADLLAHLSPDYVAAQEKVWQELQDALVALVPGAGT